MRLYACLAALALAPFASARWQAVADRASEGEGPRAEQLSLCDALGRARPGVRLSVVVAGVYLIGPEQQILYDPLEPACEQDLQPATWVEFATAARSHVEMERILQRAGRVRVVFEGELAGPKAAGPDEPDLPLNIAFARRVASSRYGHLNIFRTRLMVTKILKAEPVSGSDSWEKVLLYGEEEQEAAALVGESEVLQYPARARRIGVAGEVVLEAVFVQGQVKTVEVRSGDRLLADEAVSNLRTWRLRKPIDTTLEVVFSFKLEDRLRGASQEPTILLQLPTKVTIVAPSYRW